MSDTPTEPGWYDDPDGHKNMERYWNGDSWSGAPRKKQPEMKMSGIVTIVVGGLVLSILVWWVWLG